MAGHPKWPPAAILSKFKKKLRSVWIWNDQKCHRKWFWPIDLKWPEMRSKVIFGHPKWPPKKKILYRSEMARIAIESEFQTSKMADRSEMARNAIKRDFRTSKMSAGAIRIDLKWPEMQSKVNFGHPNWPTAASMSKLKKVAYRSEMARNAIESEFRTSKMGAGGYFVKKKKKKKKSVLI